MDERAFSFKLPKNLYQDLRRLSFVSERPMATIIRRSLFTYLNLQESLTELTALRDKLSSVPCKKRQSNLVGLLTVIIGDSNERENIKQDQTH